MPKSKIILKVFVMKNKIKFGLLVIILIIVAGVSIFLLFPNKELKGLVSQNPAEKIAVQEGTFEYVPSFENYSVKEKYYYSDDYFKNSGKEKNEHLRTMSMCLALSSITAIDKEDKAENVKNLLEDIGFIDTVVYDINEETSIDTIGTAIAHKKIDNKEVIAISVRGGQYVREWASNMIAGKNGDIKGFSDAANTVINRINEYRKSYNIEEYKIWIAGYSRAGAVSNLVGKYINENLDEFEISEDDLYVYTFEAPLSSDSKEVYENIHNVINKNDCMIYVYPEKWGMHNNGVQEVIDSENKFIPKNQIDFTNGFKIVESLDEDGNTQYISQREFLEDFINWLTKKSKVLDYSISREKYVELLEEPLSNVLGILTGKTSIEKEEIAYFFVEIADEVMKEENINELESALPDLDNMEFNFDYEKIIEILKESIDSAYHKSNVPLSEEEFQKLKDSIIPMMNATIPVLIVSVFDGNTELDLKNLEIVGFYHFATVINNFGDIIKDHYYQTNLPLIQAMDSYY